MPSVHDFFSGATPDVKGLAAFFDGLPQSERIEAACDLSAREQARLFDAAKGFRPIRIADFVPAELPQLRPVIHHGRNSLPAFTRFQKRFCRSPEEGRLWGYNQQGMIWAIGPGYFQTYDVADGEVLIDYVTVPKGRAEGWPELRDNGAGLSRFVYYRTQDLMRGVSRHVSIGRASRDGKQMDNWFVLCREE